MRLRHFCCFARAFARRLTLPLRGALPLCRACWRALPADAFFVLRRRASRAWRYALLMLLMMRRRRR